MKLRYSPTSPYVRKVQVLAMEIGIEWHLEPVATDPWSDDPALAEDNPLGKIPVLVTEEGMTLFDSPVICEYLDSLHEGTPRIPPTGPERWKTLRLQALADGIMDAAALRRLESLRSEAQQSPAWDELQRDAVSRALNFLEREVGDWDEFFDLGQISVACALGYLDLRFAAEDWRGKRPHLAGWYERVDHRESMEATRPPR